MPKILVDVLEGWNPGDCSICQFNPCIHTIVCPLANAVKAEPIEIPLGDSGMLLDVIINGKSAKIWATEGL